MALRLKKPSLRPSSKRCPSHSQPTSSSSRRCAKSRGMEKQTSQITRLTFCLMRASSGRLSTLLRSKNIKTKPWSKSSDILSTSGPFASGKWASKRPPRCLAIQLMMKSSNREVSSIFSVTSLLLTPCLKFHNTRRYWCLILAFKSKTLRSYFFAI